VFAPITAPLEPPALPDPQPLPGGAQAWRERIVSESAEIGIANAEAGRLAQVAERARANLTPDPTVGVRVLSDRGGAERVVGVVFSVPFGTDYRNALAATESANAIAAEAEAAGVRRMVEQGAWLTVQAADSKRHQWQSHQQALAAQTAAVTRTRRAWELGEAPLGEYLLAQRNLHQARLTEAQARVEALNAALLVRIDAHELWHSAAHEGDATPR
jgi:outer membrane protein TolC